MTDAFSCLLTTLAVATAQQRRLEQLRYDHTAHRHAEVAWDHVLRVTRRLIRSAMDTDENPAFRGFCLVISTLVETRGTREGRRFHHALMTEPELLSGLFRHARSDRADHLMSAASRQNYRLGEQRAFGRRRLETAPAVVAARSFPRVQPCAGSWPILPITRIECPRDCPLPPCATAGTGRRGACGQPVHAPRDHVAADAGRAGQ